jgi:hypothetical protein
MKQDSKRICIAVAAVALAAAIGFFLLEGNDSPYSKEAVHPLVVGDKPATAKSRERSDVVAPRPWFPSERPVVSPLAQAAQPASEGSRLADDLHSSEKTGMQDLKVVMNLFTQYRARFRGFPVSEDNAGFVNALTGQNPSKLGLIPRDHPAIDAKGQLLDRWGEPFFFHLIGRDALEVRSAGPDRKLYTADDLLNASAPNRDAALANSDR